ncbi:MAG: hypothetical protein AMXMBFR36_29290 [Acidobacteriota bacterium]
MKRTARGGAVVQGKSWPFAGLGLAIAIAAAAAAVGQGAPVLTPPDIVASFDREVVPAEGRQVAHVMIPEAGRWSIRAESSVGVAIQLVDRRAGAGEVVGETGSADGRIDRFFDRGEVRVVVHGPSLGRGEAKLSATPFRELAALPEKLVELRPVSTELGDLEQRSWWLEIPERRRVAFEAVGRHLSDLRLWQNGSWLIDVEPALDQVTPEPGKPLARARLSTLLEPGLYRLTAYGGPETTWTVADRARPLHLRWGIPRRPLAARTGAAVSAFGSDHFLVPSGADLYRLELPEATDALLALAPFDEADPWADGGAWSITKESVPPVAETRYGGRRGGNDWVRVTVSGAAGQRYLLQHFEVAERTELSGKGGYWLGSVHSGAAIDAIDPTGVLFAWPRSSSGHVRVAAADVVPVSRTLAWRRRFNLLETATLFFRVEEAGTYRVRSSGAAAEMRVEPLLLSPPPEYRQPRLAPSPLEVELDPGYYVLTLVPSEPGVAEVSLAHRDGAEPTADSPLRGAVRLGRVELEANTSYVLLFGDQPGVSTGAVVRKLPLDLDHGLPIALAPGAEVEIPGRNRLESTAIARTEDGTALELSVDGGEWGREVAVPAGEHRLRVRSNEATTVAATVELVPVERGAARALPPLPEAALALLPAFPRLDDRAPAAFDLAREGSATFLVEAPEPALYRLETTGLLATEGVIRTRVQPRLEQAAQNGSGRNAAIATYLPGGEFQWTVRALGQSAGRAGGRLVRTPIEDGGALADGVAARARLAPGETVAYRFDVAERGRWRLRSLAPGGLHSLRVEDLDGWPVGAATVAGDSTLELEPGSYRAIVLPTAGRREGTRAVTRVDRLVEPPALAGHGPFELALGERRRHVWTEPEEGGERAPDRWRLALPAAALLTIELSEEMQAEITGLDGTAAPAGEAARVAPGRDAVVELPEGRYELAVSCSRRNHLQPYTIRVFSAELVAGVTRATRLPVSLPVSVGSEGDVEIESFGADDVRARLYAADGSRLADADDRPGDWNFLLAGGFEPGRYRLEILPVGTTAGATELTMRSLETREEPAWAPADGARRVAVVAERARLPLALPEDADLLAISAAGGGSLGLALEREDAAGRLEVATAAGSRAAVAVPLDAAARAARWSVVVRSLDRRPTEAALTLFAGRAPRVAGSKLLAGVELPRLPGLEPPFSAAAVEVGEPGCFRPTAPADPAAIATSRRAGEPFAGRPGAWIAAGGELWLSSAGERRVSARRAALDAEPLVVTLAPGERARCGVAAASGPVALAAEALAGELAIASVEEDRPARFDRSGAVAPRRALALATAPDGAEVFNASATPLEVRLTARPLAEGSPVELDGATRELELAPRSATALALPAGPLRLELALERGAAASVAGADGRPAATIWAAEADLTESVTVDGRRLLVANPGGRAVRARVAARAASAADPALKLSPHASFERRFDRAGAFRLELAPAAGSIEVRGARSATLVGAGGEVLRGDRFEVPPAGGTLRVEHGPGMVAVWPAADAAAAAALLAGPAEAVEAPVALPLDGSRSAVRIAVAEPALLVLRAGGGAEVAVEAGGVSELTRLVDGVAFERPVGTGEVRIAVRALPGAPQGGGLEVALEPIAAIGEGLGPESLLAPGEARAWWFTVERPGSVGAGVAADDGAVESELFGPDGRSFGRALVHWHELAAGRHTLIARAPAGAEPARARPALVGVAPPSDDPPREAVARLVALERGDPPAPRAAVGAEDPPRLEPGGTGPRSRAVEEPEEWSEEGDEEWVEDEEDDEDAGWEEENP